MAYHLLAFLTACILANPGTFFDKCKPVVDTYYPTIEACAAGARELIRERDKKAICKENK